MNSRSLLTAATACLACLGMVIPAQAIQTADAQEPAQPHVAAPGSMTIVDVQLRSGGVLLGQVIDANGVPLAAREVTLRQSGRVAATATTDAGGYFFARNLRGGVYEIVAGEARGLFRLWAPNTAPPSANTGALVVAGGQPVRGQDGPIAYWLSNPFVLCGIVAGAVAVPVIIHNSRKAPRSP